MPPIYKLKNPTTGRMVSPYSKTGLNIPLTSYTTYQLKEKLLGMGILTNSSVTRAELLKKIREAPKAPIKNLTTVRAHQTHAFGTLYKEEVKTTKGKTIHVDELELNTESMTNIFNNPKTTKDYKWIANGLKCKTYSAKKCSQTLGKIFISTGWSIEQFHRVLYFIVLNPPINREWNTEVMRYFKVNMTMLRQSMKKK